MYQILAGIIKDNYLIKMLVLFQIQIKITEIL